MDDEIRALIESEKNASPAVVEPPSDAMKLVEAKQSELLGDEQVQKFASVLATEDIKAQYAEKGAEIRRRNIKTAETEFETETREQRLKLLRKELDRDHRYKMGMIDADGKHNQMLDRRKKVLEEYGYLYEQDEEGRLIDFSYSVAVNRIRAFARNISRLDTAIRKVIKWTVIIGLTVTAWILYKKFGG